MSGVVNRKNRHESIRDLKNGVTFTSLVDCRFCKGQAQFCHECVAEFDRIVPENMLESIAYGTNAADEAKELYKDLSDRVDKQIAVNRRIESAPGKAMTRRQRRQTEKRVKLGCEVGAIAENLLRDKKERAGLLVSQSPLDAMPQEFVVWLAMIDDQSRAWLHAHQKRIDAHKKSMSTDAVDAITCDDAKIDVNKPLPSLSLFKDDQSLIPKDPRLIGVPSAVAKLPPYLKDVASRITARARRQQLESQNNTGRFT